MERPGGLFRKQALERLSSPERLDELLVVLGRGDWTLLVTAAALVIAALAWGALGRIPLYAEGRAVLARPGAVAPVAAHAAGVLERLDLAVGARVEAGQAVAWLGQPLLEQRLAEGRLALERALAHQAARRAGQAAEHAVAREGLEARRARAERRIDEARAAVAVARRDLERAAGHDRARVAELEALARAHLAAAREREVALRRLKAEGTASDQAVVDAERVALTAASTLGDLDVRALGLSQAEINAEQAWVEALHRTLDVEDALAAMNREEAGLAAREAELAADQALELAAARAAVEAAERELADAATLRAARSGVVLEVAVVVGDHVAAGQRLASVQVDGSGDGPLVALGFFAVKGGKLVAPGARAELTPDMVERERFGGVLGHVREVATFPVSTAAASSLVGDRELAASLTAEGRQVHLTIDLAPAADTPSGVAWTLSGGPDLTLSEGTTADVRVRVEEVPPLALLLPALRRLLLDRRPDAR
ncbi:MAG: NHLP bacteriocin system secretion protein [Planctomycetes bacterium]|nr:NHLP bacteriocin system secretion protein [Planctomycetota bacterium]